MNCGISIPGPKKNEISGMILGPPSAPSFTVQIESIRDTHLFRWIIESQIKSHVQIRLAGATEEEQGKTSDLYDVHSVSYDEYYKRKRLNAIKLDEL